VFSDASGKAQIFNQSSISFYKYTLIISFAHRTEVQRCGARVVNGYDSNLCRDIICLRTQEFESPPHRFFFAADAFELFILVVLLVGRRDGEKKEP
jgi:hypothetical protein